MKRLLFLTVLGLIGVACGGGGTTIGSSPSASTTPSPSESPIPPNTVIVSNNSFSPSRITVAAGTTITWSNIGTNPHNVVSAEKLFNSNPSCQSSTGGCMKVGETFRFAFAKAGTYKYICFVHGFCDKNGVCSGMSGIVTVT